MRSFDFSNDTFDFRNLSRLIYQMIFLYFQNETDMDLIHVKVSVGVKLYSRTGGHSVNGHNTTKRGSEGVLVKNGDVPLDSLSFPRGVSSPLS